MFRRSIIIVMSLVLVLSSAMIKPVEAKNKTKYSIQMSKKSYGMGYTHRIKFGKKKI